MLAWNRVIVIVNLQNENCKIYDVITIIYRKYWISFTKFYDDDKNNKINSSKFHFSLICIKIGT